MAIIGSHENENTPFLREYMHENPTLVGTVYRIDKIVVVKKGLFITTADDNFCLFVWNGTKLKKSLLAKVRKNHKSQTRNLALGIRPDDAFGEYTILEMEDRDCVVQYGETQSGNDKYEQDHVELLDKT